MIWAESWCEVGNFIVAVIVCFSGVIGGVFAYHRWQHERRLERANRLKDILAAFDSTKICELVNRLDSEGGSFEWFSKLTDESEAEVMRSFRFLSYVCYLHDKNLISDEEFVLFEGQIKAVLRDEDVQTYLTDTPIEIDGDAAKGQFAYLIRYAQSIGAYPIRRHPTDIDHPNNLRPQVNSTHKPDVPIDDFTEPTAVIKINQKFRTGMSERDLYEATRGWWRVGRDAVDRIKLVLSVADGTVKEAYRVSEWHYQVGMDSGRMAFTGEVDVDAHDKFVGRSVRNLFTKGAANPIRYFALEKIGNNREC